MSETDRAAAPNPLQVIYDWCSGAEQRYVISRADSMHDFAEGDPTINLGQWRDWYAACCSAGKRLPPSDFKKKAHG
jgi:hypothetical protein